jgi:arylsulfatase A-like enzyme
MGLVKQIDDHLGRLFAHLEASGRMDDTMIVFTSDHGDYLGDHWLGEKELFHEPSIRVPLIVYDPDAAADATRGTVDNGFVEAIDLVPSFLEAAGVPIADHMIEGKSFLDRVRGAGKPARDHVYCELDYAYYRARLELGVDPHEARSFMIRTERWKYVDHLGFRPQLFDLENDPDELTDLGADRGHEAVRRELKDRLFERMALRKARVAHPTAAVEQRTDGSRNVGVIIGEW